MNVVSFLYAFLLFFVLTPGILVVLPKNGKKMMVAGVHALIFSLVFVFTNPLLIKNTHFMFEGFKEGAGGSSRDNKPSVVKNDPHAPKSGMGGGGVNGKQ